jgi:hypothetical protein
MDVLAFEGSTERLAIMALGLLWAAGLANQISTASTRHIHALGAF